MTTAQHAPVRRRADVIGAAGRLHALDGLRAFLMLLGIPFHASLVWSDSSPLLDKAGDFVHVWRMPAFFVLAGFFAWTVARRRGPWSWFRERTLRLGIPLVSCLLLLNSWHLLLLARHETGSWTAARARWLAMATNPDGEWLLHLWFLLFLIIYCALVALLVSSSTTQLGRRLSESLKGMQTRPLAVVTASSVLVAATGVAVAVWDRADVAGSTRQVLTADFVLYGACTFAGVLLAATPRAVGSLVSARPLPLFGAVVAATGMFYVIDNVWAPGSSQAVMLRSAMGLVAGVLWCAALWWLAHRLWPSPRPTVLWLVDASLVVYLVHTSFVLTLGIPLLSLGIPPILGFCILVASTVVLSLVTYEVVNRIPALRLLLTGRRRRGSSFSGLRTRGSS